MTQASESAEQPPDLLRARLHPWTVLGLWGWHTALALCAAWPAASLAQTFYGGSPRGDAELWDPGGHALLDFLWHGARSLAPVAASVKAVLVVGAVAGLVPMAASMFALTCEARHHRFAGLVRNATRALRSMPALVLLLVIVTGAQAAFLGVGVLLAKGVSLWFEASLGDAQAQRLAVAIALGFALVASGISVVHDLARAFVVLARARDPCAGHRGARIWLRTTIDLVVVGMALPGGVRPDTGRRAGGDAYWRTRGRGPRPSGSASSRSRAVTRRLPIVVAGKGSPHGA